MLKYFCTTACWPELVFGTNYVKPINELLLLIKIIDLIPVSLITFSLGHINGYLLSKYLLIFYTRCFKTRYLCWKIVQLIWSQTNFVRSMLSVTHVHKKYSSMLVKRKYHWAFPFSILQDSGDAIWNLELFAILTILSTHV